MSNEPTIEFWYKEETENWILSITATGEDVEVGMNFRGKTKDEAINSLYDAPDKRTAKYLKNMADRVRKHEIFPYTSIENMLYGEAEKLEKDME